MSLPRQELNGVVKTTFHGTYGTDSAGFRMFWGLAPSGYPYTSTALASFADAVFDAFQTNVLSMLTSHWTLNSVVAEDLSVTGTEIGVSSRAADSGAQSGIVSANDAIVISFHIPSKYRGGHPRQYLPCFGSGSIDTPTSWKATDTAALGTAYVNFVSDVITSSAAVALGTTHHGALRHNPASTPPWDWYTVASYAVQGRIGSQRRRVPR